MKKFKGVIGADIIEVRFAYGGRVVKVNKRAGGSVKIGDIIASLDRREMQAQLDTQLADYNRSRASFDTFNMDNPAVTNDKIKNAKTAQQALLDASIKQVEISKLRLDAADLISPVTGIITDDGQLRTNMFVTPSSYPYKILDTNSYSLNFLFEPKDLKLFKPGDKHRFKLDWIKDAIDGTV